VQTRLPSVKWNHVSSKENPADCASRSLLPVEFINHFLWWSGPAWLRQPSPAWPIHRNLKDQFEFNYKTIDSELQDSKTHTHVSDVSEWELPNKVSTWTKLIRITAFVKCFISNLKCRTFRLDNKSACLSAAELKEASLFWLRYVQQSNFQNEIQALKVNRSVSKSSCLASLSSFLGEDKLIRLGEQIENSPLSFKESNHFTETSNFGFINCSSAQSRSVRRHSVNVENFTPKLLDYCCTLQRKALYTLLRHLRTQARAYISTTNGKSSQFTSHAFSAVYSYGR